MLNPKLTLVLGGARSGKSAYAEDLVEAMGPKRLYAATARNGDDELAARIATHQDRRGAGWQTIEMDGLGLLDLSAHASLPLLLDCLTLWLAFRSDGSDTWERELDALLTACAARKAPVVLVSNELGLGLVPTDAQTRAFRDAHGKMNQIAARKADRVVFVTAGLPMVLK